MTIDRDTLGNVAALSDDLGVLSLYVDADPSERAHRPTVWEVQIKNEFAELRSTVKSNETRERAKAIQAALGELAPEIERTAHPSTHGRGRALFAALGASTKISLEFQLPIETRVVLATNAFIRPLLAAFEQGRPAGLVTLSRSGVVVYGWDFGAVEVVERWSIDVETSEWRRLKGPAGSNPALSQQTAPQHDRFERRRAGTLPREYFGATPTVADRLVLRVSDDRLRHATAANCYCLTRGAATTRLVAVCLQHC